MAGEQGEKTCRSPSVAMILRRECAHAHGRLGRAAMLKSDADMRERKRCLFMR